jgi:hypothetical protein
VPGKLQQPPQPLYNFDDVVLEIKRKMQNCQQLAKERLVKFKEAQGQKVKSNEYNFNTNDLVLLRIETRQKLEPSWKGPFEIQEMKKPNAIIQELGKRKKREVHINRLKPYFSSLSEARDATPQLDPHVNAVCVVGTTTSASGAGRQIKNRAIFR